MREHISILFFLLQHIFCAVPHRSRRFQSTLPSRGATTAVMFRTVVLTDFNPRSPRGERLRPALTPATVERFQSTLPSRGATAANTFQDRIIVISIHAPLAGSDARAEIARIWAEISIHAPLAGSDCTGRSAGVRPPDFNPRSPCGERRWYPSIRRIGSNFNPRSPCGERLLRFVVHQCLCPFQSTLPLRGATCHSDSPPPLPRFQSTLPLRGATRLCSFFCKSVEFQSTLPLRGATAARLRGGRPEVISIHAPLAGSDSRYLRGQTRPVQFQSTLPLRGATR